MRGLAAAAALALLSGCVTIDRRHAELATANLGRLDTQEAQSVGVLDYTEDVARKKVDVEMMHVIGPEILREFLLMKDNEGNTFNDNVCRATGLDQAQELLQFMLALSRKFEERRKKEWAPHKKALYKARKAVRDEFNASRQGLSALETVLRAYIKDKEWQGEMLRRLGAPMDDIERLNNEAKKGRAELKKHGIIGD